jgi:hypothetical protein
MKIKQSIVKMCAKKFPSGSIHGHYTSETCPYCPLPKISKAVQDDFVWDLPPRYRHDSCPNCQYLGRLNDYDLYYCEGILTKTVLARFSHEPSEYMSGWGSIQAPLLVAEALAYRKNLVSKDKIG